MSMCAHNIMGMFTRVQMPTEATRATEGIRSPEAEDAMGL